MYFVLVTRLRVIFQSSVFAYSKYILNSLSLFVIISMYGLIIADIVFISGDIQTYPWLRCIRIQTSTINIILCKLFLSLDACLSLLCLFLFLFKMKQCLINTNKFHKKNPAAHVRNNSNNNKQKEFNQKLSYIMTKYSVLTLISVISTSFFIITYSFIDISTSHSLCFDSMINAFCLLVMAKFYDNIYKGCPICYYLFINFKMLFQTNINIQFQPNQKPSDSKYQHKKFA